MAAGPAPAPAPAPTPAPAPAAPAPSPAPATSLTPGANEGVFNDATANINQQAAAALAALANGGTAGLAAWNAAQQANTADRTAAINQTLSGARQLNAPAGAGAALSQIVNTPFDQYGATNSALSNAFGAATATREAGARQYFTEAAQAVPVVRAQAEAKLALARQNAADRAAAVAARSAKAGSTPGGAGTTAKMLSDAFDQYVAGQTNSPGTHATAGTLKMFPALGGWFASVDTANGWAPGTAQAMWEKANPDTAVPAPPKGPAVSQNDLTAGVGSARNYLTSQPNPTFAAWWAAFTQANPGLDPATLAAIRANTQPLFG